MSTKDSLYLLICVSVVLALSVVSKFNTNVFLRFTSFINMCHRRPCTKCGKEVENKCALKVHFVGYHVSR